MIKVAMLSYWHVHAKDYARQANEHPETEIVAVWDELTERGREKAKELNVPFFESLDELLAFPGLEGVIVSTPTNLHRDVMVAAAKAGKHIFTEKVVASTLKECNEILAAVEQNEVKLTVSLPRLYHGYTLAIQKIVEQGLLGKLTLARVRLAHGGAVANWLPPHFFNLEQCAGGALIDLGCHPMYLTRLFLGLPESVSAHYGYVTGKEVEDNAVAVLKYPDGALGIVEAGFANKFSPFTIELHGTEGSLLYGFADGKLQLKTSLQGEEEAKRWTEWESADNEPEAFKQWVTHIKQNTVAEFNIAAARDLTILMEAANLSARDNRTVRLDSLVR